MNCNKRLLKEQRNAHLYSEEERYSIKDNPQRENLTDEKALHCTTMGAIVIIIVTMAITTAAMVTDIMATTVLTTIALNTKVIIIKTQQQ